MITPPTLDITIIAACRNEIGHIRQFLDSLFSQDMSGLTWEAVIADGSSDDGTRQVLADYVSRHPQLRTIDNPKRIVSPGLNAAIRAARGRVVMRMDAHTSYAPDYCKRCLMELARTGADNVGGPARTTTQGTRARAFAAAYHSRFSTGARFHDDSYEGWVDTVPYGCWRKETLERLGLFDEALVRNQDDELNLRIIRAGGRIWQSPEIRSWYSPRVTLRALFLQYFQYGFWKAAVIRKHHLPGSWRHLVPVAFVLAHAILLAACIVTAAADPAVFLGAARLWLLLIVSYGAANLTASVAAAAKSGWSTLPYLPAVFTVYHFSWGLGFLAGVRWFLPSAIRPAGDAALFTRISR
jgi:glycosyltransferase involved in cell wall biosynthesis